MTAQHETSATAAEDESLEPIGRPREHAAAWTRSALIWRVTYGAFAAAITAFSLRRMLWAWPDAAWQTTLSDIEAVDRVLNNGLAGEMQIGVGGEHALTGYRWFQYFNAEVFGLNAQIELYAYFLLTLGLALLIGARIFRELDRSGAGWPARLLAFAIPLVLSSLVGAGSRGMEIGQFTGMTLFVVLSLLIETRLSLRTFTILTIVAVPTATLLILGSYSGAPAMALVLVAALQFVRPTVDRPSRAKLFVLAGAFLASIAGWLLLLAFLGPADLNNRFGQFTEQVAQDPMFIVKYFLGGAAGSVISVQTLEVSGHGSHFAYAVGAVVVVFVLATLVLAYRRAWHGSTVPLLLTAMPVFLAVTLVVGRSEGTIWMLSPWYAFHLRLFVVAGIWLLVRAVGATRRWAWLNRSLSSLVQAVGVLGLAAVLGVVVVANTNQWRREPAERLYFQNVQRVLLYPRELAVGANGETQLVIPLRQSEEAIELLRKNHLSVYRDPQAVLKAMGDSGAYDAVAARRTPDVTVSGMLDEQWVGPAVKITVQNPSCATLHIKIAAFPAVVGELGAADVGASVLVSPNFGAAQRVELGSSTVALDLRPSGAHAEVDLAFSRTWNPAKLGVGADKRELSATLVADCG